MDGHGLQEDSAGGSAQRDRAGEDDDRDDEGDGGVDVISPGVFGEPDEESTCDDADVSECVTHHMKENSFHVQVSM